ncbi:hypothetical protein HCO18_004301 [Salmonella enterica]|nr:hypothetical protein [Salmonella enterica subsp. enterica serovar Javiana]EEP9293630.1 hypothetical protein [Salmonella enterica]EGX8329239.1 hypothetical protein [Salmonella enterica subsp. enterica serovar Javiana]
MKQKLIALAVAAASAVVSGASMAANGGEWQPAGIEGGTVKFSGALTLAGGNEQPWEVSIGSPVTELNTNIKQSQTVVDIVLPKTLPVLSISPRSTQAFNGKQGITPQIDYHGAVDIKGFNKNETTLTLDVTDTSAKKIGVMTTKLFAGAVYSSKSSNNSLLFAPVAPNPGSGFYGGLPSDIPGTEFFGPVLTNLTQLAPTAVGHFDRQGIEAPLDRAVTASFKAKETTYSAVYGSGIPASAGLKITLTEGATDNINWQASLPITISYM